MIKILMITGDAGEAQEIYYAKFRLEEEGWQVDIAAPEKRVFLSVVHDFEPGFDTYTEKPGYRVQADLGLDEVAAESYARAGPARRPGTRVPAEPREGRSDRPPLPRTGQADRGQLPWPPLGPGRRRRRGTDHDRLSRSPTRPPKLGSRVRQSGRRRRRSPCHGPGLARQWTLDEGVRPASESHEARFAGLSANPSAKPPSLGGKRTGSGHVVISMAWAVIRFLRLPSGRLWRPDPTNGPDSESPHRPHGDVR